MAPAFTRRLFEDVIGMPLNTTNGIHWFKASKSQVKCAFKMALRRGKMLHKAFLPKSTDGINGAVIISHDVMFKLGYTKKFSKIRNKIRKVFHAK